MAPKVTTAQNISTVPMPGLARLGKKKTKNSSLANARARTLCKMAGAAHIGPSALKCTKDLCDEVLRSVSVSAFAIAQRNGRCTVSEEDVDLAVDVLTMLGRIV